MPPSVWGENLMWIAMSHCGAYEASDATVECVLCVCYNCFKSVDLFTQIVQGSFHTFICSFWTVSGGGGVAGEDKLIQELAPAEVLEVLGSRQSEFFEWVRLRLDLWSFMTRCASNSSIPTAGCGNNEEEKQQWTENHFWKWNGFRLIRPGSQVLRCVKIKSNKSDEHHKIDTYIDFCILPSV